MERMAERRGDDLSERRTLRAGRVETSGGDLKRAVAAGNVAELVNHGALLRNDEQQQQAQQFKHVSHSNSHDGFRRNAPQRQHNNQP